MHRLLAAALCLLALSTADASKVKLWQQHAPSHYDKAKLSNTVVSSEGVVRLARQLRPLTDIKADHIWDIAEDAAGNLYLATGGEGKIYKVTPDGASKVLYTAKDSQVFCLHLTADSTLYAGTGPSGQVVRISGDGKASVVAEKLGNYVWSLTSLPRSKAVFAGTGPEGRIYKISEGKAEPFFKTKQDHVLCLASDPEGKVLYAGTDKGGLVYRIGADAKGFVLYQTAQAEVRSLLVTKDFIYAGTSAPTKRGGAGSGKSAGSGGDGASLTPGGGPGGVSTADEKKPRKLSDDGDDKEVDTDPGDKRPTTSPGESKGASSSPFPAAGAGDNSIYRIAADGTVREIFREKTLMLSLLSEGGRLLVGTGMNGQIFEVDDASRERSEIARLEHGQVHCLLRRGDRSIVLGTGDPGKLYILEDRLAPKGTVLSEVLDTKIVSKWGALSWTANTPADTKLTVAVRSGNVAEPDDTWSDWSAEQTDAATARVLAPTARFLQYRVTLSSENPKGTPELRGLTIRYKTTNQSPEIGSLEVPNLETGTVENPRKFKIRWTATDPNEDELTYSLFFRKEGWKSWVLMEDDLEKKDFEWDTTTVPSGAYQVKLVVSDRRDNGPEDALAAERISPLFPVTHESPQVKLKLVAVEGDQAVIEASATDPMVRLTDAAFAINGKRWTNVFPTDGLFDSKTETFRFRTESLRPGNYVLVLRVRDAAGNAGTGDVLFSVRGKE